VDQWLDHHELLIGWLTLASGVVFIGTLLLVPWIAARIPPDYFAHDRRREAPPIDKRPWRRGLMTAGKNLLGGVMVVAGMFMLVLPGQGILTILLGGMLLDFPGKYRLERWIISRETVFQTVNRLRLRAGRKPLVR
jgi:hypothetical protein